MLHFEINEDIHERLKCDKLPCAVILLALTSILVIVCQHEKSMTDFDIELYDL
jgi:hypothetical protein